MERIGQWLLVEDNSGCGGAAVTFTGLYQQQEISPMHPALKIHSLSGRFDAFSVAAGARLRNTFSRLVKLGLKAKQK
jgi:hypothetical protein